MKRSELIHAIYADNNPKNLSLSEVSEVIERIIESLTDALKRGWRTEIRGFGALFIVQMASRTGRNPKTGEPVIVPSRPKIRFRAGAPLIKGLNTGGPHHEEI